MTPPDSPAEHRPPLYLRVGRLVALVDRFGVDGLINACGFMVFATAEGLRMLHNGKIQVALIVALAVLVVILVAVMLGVPALFTGVLPQTVTSC